MNLQQSIRRILKEETLKETVRGMVKTHGLRMAAKIKNVMVFEESDNGIYVYINYDIIFGPLANFRETVRYDEKMQTIKRWLTRAYGVETINIIHIDSFHPGSEEFGVYETLI